MDLFESFISSQRPSEAAASTLRDYFEWQIQHRSSDFIPSADDDVDLRNYLFHLHTQGVDRAALKERVAALERFYRWAQTEGRIAYNPFDDYDFDIPLLTSEQIHVRQQTQSDNLRRREVDRLLALNQIVEALNNSVDIQGALDSTLKTLLDVMNLQTGWISMLTESHLGAFLAGDSQPNDFTLAATCGLPPGLDRDDHRFLRQSPACHCQKLLIQGRLTRPINIIECTRLRDSRRAEGDNRGLRFHASVPLISQGKPLGLINVAAADWQLLTRTDLHFLSAVSAQLVVALERAHFYEAAEAQRIHIDHLATLLHEINQTLEAKVLERTLELAAANASLEKANQQLQELDDLKSAFLGVISHELRTPFTSILLSMQLWQHNYLENMQPEQQQLFQQLNANIEAAKAMIDNLVDYTTFIRKQGTMKLAPVKLGVVAATMLLLFKRQAEHKAIALVIDIPDDLPETLGDEERLADAIYELVKNAVKFTPTGGKITLRARLQGTMLNFAVQDTGVGVPAEKLATLWEGFHQMADPLRRGKEGLGLGLALVKYIIEAHKGEVWAESQVGVGSAFGFRLPVS
ncbi:MAG: ATP-binding protein [Anaerolineales bacterium]